MTLSAGRMPLMMSLRREQRFIMDCRITSDNDEIMAMRR